MASRPATLQDLFSSPLPPSEEIVEYHIYPVLNDSVSIPQLTQLAETYYQFLYKNFFKDYLWQDEPFNLQIWNATKMRDKSRVGDIHHIYGRTRFGDNIEDEWFIVFMLFELSKAFPDIVISVFDVDGQFLLIEAAHYLPRWLRPENSDHRVWIKGGQLHIIPIAKDPKDEKQTATFPTKLTLPKAFEILQTHPETTVASSDIQKQIFSRLRDFPKKAYEESHHYSRIIVPLPIAYILQKKPELISHAVTTFYYREPIAFRVCHKMEKFNPKTHPNVLIRVRFTRCLFAQLIKQRFQPPRVYADMVPSPSDPNHKPFDLGMKVACGFEMLYSEGKKKEARARQTALTDYDFDNDDTWHEFRNNLQSSEYFHIVEANSKEYKDLEKKAKIEYLESLRKSNNPKIREYEPKEATIARDIDEILNSLSKMTAADFPSDSVPPSDPEDWLQVAPDYVDKILQERQYINFKKDRKSSEGDDSEAEANDEQSSLSTMVSDWKRFVQKVSSYEGAELPADGGDDSEDEEFDYDKFIQTVRDMTDGPRRGLDSAKSSASKKRTHHKVTTTDKTQTATTSMSSPSNTLPQKHSQKETTEHSVGSFLSSESDEPDEFYEDLGDDDEEGNGQSEMRLIMQQMDRELAQTEVGKTFERVPKVVKKRDGADVEMKDENDEDSMDTNPTESEPLQPVDIDLNLVKNFLQSLAAQEGMAGPVANLMAEFKDAKSQAKK
jgi:hypothetical protein